MDYLKGDQISLLAEIPNTDSTGEPDWAIDCDRTEADELEDIRRRWVARANGGQLPKPTDNLVDGDGGQTTKATMPMGGKIEPRGWFEIEKRKSGSYKYFRWRDDSGCKRSQYIGRVEPI